MKKLLCLLAFAASFGAAAQPTPAPADAYATLMAATIAEQNAAEPAALPGNIAKLERAASAKPTDWLPRYYQARAYIKLGFAFSTPDGQKDQVLDQAQAALDQARKLPGADQAEVLVLQAYLYQGRIMVDPMTRGQDYASQVGEVLGQAQVLAPNNPRLYLVLANNMYYRPALYGGGASRTKPLYEKAKALFATFKPATALSPSWGESNVLAQLQEIATEEAAAN